MRVLLLTSVATGCLMTAGFLGCSKSEPTEPLSESIPESELPAVVALQAPPPPAEPVPTAVPVLPTPNYFAPEGIYFLISAVSVETSDGLTGLRPGTRLTKQADGKYQAGEHLLELQANQVTNDLRIAGRFAGHEQAAQASLREAGTQQATRVAAATTAAQVTAAAATEAAAAPASRSSSTTGISTQASGMQTAVNLGAKHGVKTETYWEKNDGSIWIKGSDGRWHKQ